MELDPEGDGLEVCRGENITVIGSEEEDVRSDLQSWTCAGWWDPLLRRATGRGLGGVHFWVCWFEVSFRHMCKDDQAMECRGG